MGGSGKVCMVRARIRDRVEAKAMRRCNCEKAGWCKCARMRWCEGVRKMGGDVGPVVKLVKLVKQVIYKCWREYAAKRWQ